MTTTTTPPEEDRRRATIVIGGQLTRESRERLIDAVLEDGPGPQLRQYFANPDELIQVISTTIAQSQPLYLADHRARNGQFAAVELMCRKHGMTFRRHSFARARHEGEIHLHIPDVADYAVAANQAGVPYATHKDIRDYSSRKALRDLVAQLEGVLQPIPPLTAL